MGLAAERERLEGLGLSQEVVRTIQVARADSTRACYSAKWAAFQKTYNTQLIKISGFNRALSHKYS